MPSRSTPKLKRIQMKINNKTDSGKAILAFIIKFRKAEGRPPTFREVQNHMGFSSPNAVTYQVKVLRSIGLLKTGPKLETP